MEQAETFFSGLNQIIEKQNNEISQLKNKSHRLQLENESKLKFYVIMFKDKQ